MAVLTLEEKVGQMLVVGFQGHEAPPHILYWLREGRIGGVILFARNVDSPRQLEALIRSLEQTAKHQILVAIDQEGGTVARLRGGYTESPGAMALGAADNPDLSKQVSGVLATELRALGVNWNLAPAIDVTGNIHNPSVGTRSLGSDPDHVAVHAVAQIRGFQEKGIAATAKHFPGKANTPVDPHVELPMIEGNIGEMWGRELLPFREACRAGVAAMLVTHAQFIDLEPDHPSTMSPKIIQELLREKIGFRGLVTTDCMEMKAITNSYGPGESAVKAATAGANILLYSHTQEYQEAAYDALLEAAKSGRLPMRQLNYSVQRITEMKSLYPIHSKPPIMVIRSPSHINLMRRAARAGTVLLREEPGTIPINPVNSVGLVEFASHLEKEILKEGTATAFAAIMRERLPNLMAVWLDPTDPTYEQIQGMESLIKESETIIYATRNAHLCPNQRDAVRSHLYRSDILVCLRNPYDAGILNAGTTLLTLGDSTPSLYAAADALMGVYKPSGKLHVPLTIG